MKLWVYLPRSSGPEIHTSAETILKDMAEDIEWAKEENSYYEITDEYIYVDDGGHAYLVDVVEGENGMNTS